MDGFLVFQMHLEKQEMAMLKRVIKYLVLFFLMSCDNKNITRERNIEHDIKIRISDILNREQYASLITQINDSIRIWKLNKLVDYFEDSKVSEYKPDSLICINASKSRLVSCLIGRTYLKPSTASITFFYGEKISERWYFFSGDNIFVPAEMKLNNNQQPFTFEQLHQIALKEIYSGYLNERGEINEDWFTSQFEDNGWGNFDKQQYSDWCFKGKRYNNKKEFYIACHLCKVKANWASRDTTQPVKQLPKKDEAQP